MVLLSKMLSSTTLHSPSTLLPYSSHDDLLYPPPPHTHKQRKQALMQAHLWCQDKGNSQQCNYEGGDAMAKDLGDISGYGSLQKDGERVLWRWQIQAACDDQGSICQGREIHGDK